MNRDYKIFMTFMINLEQNIKIINSTITKKEITYKSLSATNAITA